MRCARVGVTPLVERETAPATSEPGRIEIREQVLQRRK
jgi:hypothetical protein